MFSRQFRLVFSQYLDLHRNLRNVKEKPNRKTCFSHKKILTSTRQNFTRQQFFKVNRISIVFSQEVDIKVGECI